MSERAPMREELLVPRPVDTRRRSPTEAGAATRAARRVRRPARAQGAPDDHARGRPPRGQAADHLLFAGPPGSRQDDPRRHHRQRDGRALHTTSGPALERAGDLAAILTKLDDGDVLFIDEIHRLARTVEEILYPAMEDFQLDIVARQGPGGPSIRLDLPRVHPRRRHDPHRAHHRPAARPLRLRRPARLLRPVDDSRRSSRAPRHPRRRDRRRRARAEIARRARGTPRIANRLLRRVRDFAEVRGDGVVDAHGGPRRLAVFGVDELGLDKVDRAILAALCAAVRRRSGRSVDAGHRVGEQPETVEDVYEPFLIQQGLLMRTPRGRVAMPRGMGSPRPGVATEPRRTDPPPGLFG